MKRLLISAIALTGLGGCATYDYVGGSAPGGYYQGSQTYEYAYPDSYWGGYGGGLGYGYYGYGGYGGSYGYYPGYYYNPPYYVVRPRPPRDHDDGHRPPPVGGPDGPRPWRRPDGSYAVPGRTMTPPRRGTPSAPAPSRGSNDTPSPPRSVPRPGNASPPPMSRPSAPPSRPSLPPRLTPRSQPSSSGQAVPRASHFRNRPVQDDR